MDLEWVSRKEALEKIFRSFATPEERYSYLLELGKTLPLLSIEACIPSALVDGCQSLLYLQATLTQGRLYFAARSESLFSKGLASLLIGLYGGLPPQTILLYPPSFLEPLGVFASLSPGRSNGLAQMYLRMKQEALKNLIAQTIS
jgi:cysteine desulfuration protein SufE